MSKQLSGGVGGGGRGVLEGGASLCQAQLLLQGLGHLGGRGAGQAEVDLDRVVDEPLQGRQGTDHDDTGHQTLPHTCTGPARRRRRRYRELLYMLPMNTSMKVYYNLYTHWTFEPVNHFI